MADRGGLLTLEDQGTIFMFSLLLVLIIAAVLYFACTWYRKKKTKESPEKTSKPAVSKTFSRFSQVDEELTVHMGTLEEILDDDDDDDDDDENRNEENRKTDYKQKTNSETVDGRPPYLETDM